MSRRRFSRAPDAQGRKALQLCRQVAEALHWALGGCGDAVLHALRVVSVEPAPNAVRLLVTVEADGVAPVAALEHLRRAAGLLRSEVAAGINRRRAPELTFRVQ